MSKTLWVRHYEWDIMFSARSVFCTLFSYISIYMCRSMYRHLCMLHIHTYVHTYIYKYVYVCVGVCIPIFVFKMYGMSPRITALYIHTYIHTYIHNYLRYYDLQNKWKISTVYNHFVTSLLLNLVGALFHLFCKLHYVIYVWLFSYDSVCDRS
jgi:hypothetical protein